MHCYVVTDQSLCDDDDSVLVPVVYSLYSAVSRAAGVVVYKLLHDRDRFRCLHAVSVIVGEPPLRKLADMRSNALPAERSWFG